MDSPFSSASRFRFRDDGIGNSTGSDSISSDISDFSSEEHELHLQSMTGKVRIYKLIYSVCVEISLALTSFNELSDSLALLYFVELVPANTVSYLPVQ